MYSSFFSWDVILLETEWNLAKIDESVNKTCKTHKKHRIDRIQTCISLKIKQLEIWKLVSRLEMYSSLLYWEVLLLKLNGTTRKSTNLSINTRNTQNTSYWQDTNVYISESETSGFLKTVHYTLNVFFFLFQRCNSSWNWMEPRENCRICQ